jgi:hypothetical protein
MWMKVSEGYSMVFEALSLVSNQVELQKTFIGGSKPYCRVACVDFRQTIDHLVDLSGYHPPTT